MLMSLFRLVIFGVAFGVASAPSHADDVHDIERAHGLAAWWSTDVLRADVTITFGGNTAVDGTMTFETNGPRARLDLARGGTILYDGETCWLSPATLEMPRARFHVLTWMWFTAAPFKLGGEGVHLAVSDAERPTTGSYFFAHQTFASDAGDTPDDWYDIWIDRETHRVAAMGYIVTYGRSLDEANAEPHAIAYHDFETVDGVTLATRWTFHDYSRETGVGERLLGTGSLSDLRFEKLGTQFTKPADAREVPLPE